MTQRSLFGDLPEEDGPRFANGPVVRGGHDGPVAAVAIEDSVDKLLDYAIPDEMINQVMVGQRVKVPLGRGNRSVHGFVVELKDRSDCARVKQLLAIEDARALITGKLLELSRWISRYYCAPLGTVLDSVIPSAVKKRIGMQYLQMVRLAKPRDQIQAIFETTRSGKRKAILAHLLQLEPDHAIELVRLAQAAGTTAPTVRKLVRLGLITVKPEADMEWGTGEESCQSDGLPIVEESNVGECARGDAETTESLDCRIEHGRDGRATGGPSASSGDSQSAIGNRQSTIASQSPIRNPQSAISLNPDQQAVFDDIAPRARAGGFSTNLLFGVTGSGKTELYLRCIELVVQQGRQAIVLVPEIALTPQTVRRFTTRFPRVAILHSGLSATLRHRFWQQCASGWAQVVVGARSAIFAPVKNLGIIVVDEEHEGSYKQDQAPRYHARDVAIMRAKMEEAPILLGSATPSLESWWRAGGPKRCPPPAVSPTPATPASTAAMPVEGASAVSIDQPAAARQPATSPHHLLILPHRVRGLSLPTVDLVDMKEDSRNRERGHIHLFSRRLETLLKQTLEAKHQAILLLNRRGYSNFVYCASCQEPLHCRYCDATMTYHRSASAQVSTAGIEQALHTGQLMCHYCLAVGPLPAQCPTCSKKLTLFGLGTQRVEEELARKFPGITLARVDSDAMHSAADYEQILGRFSRGEIQVMLGTQMIAKGLDYPNVTLVGVINGDTALSLPDFRAAERTFQLITQVAGRAGRGDAPGRVVVQTFMPDDPAIQAAMRQDFIGFAHRELINRRQVGHPPFGRVVRIVLRDQDQEKLQKKSHDLAERVAEAVGEVMEEAMKARRHEGTKGEEMSSEFRVPGSQSQAARQRPADAPTSQSAIRNPQSAIPIALRGPMPCAISRIAGYFRDQIVLSCVRVEPLQKVLAILRDQGHLSTSDRVAVDVDPVSLL